MEIETENPPIRKRKRTYWHWGILFAITIIALYAVLNFLPNKSYSNPLKGKWQLTDLRVPNGAPEIVLISADGTMEHDQQFMVRLQPKDGVMMVRAWGKVFQDGDNNPFKVFKRTIKSWNANSDDFEMLPEYSEDGNEIKLALPGEPPHLIMKRVE